MELFLHTFCYQPEAPGVEAGVFGRLEIEGETVAYTVEQPWRDNRPFESCVPEGGYTLVPYTSSRFGECFILVNPYRRVYATKEDRLSADDRYKCLFAHPGNWSSDFQGCIGLGRRLMASAEGQLGVASSRDTCADILGRLSREQHDLYIHRGVRNVGCY